MENKSRIYDLPLKIKKKTVNRLNFLKDVKISIKICKAEFEIMLKSLEN